MTFIKKLIWAAILTFVYALPNSAGSQNLNTSLISKIPEGASFYSVLCDTVVFSGNGSALDIVDISDPSSPVLLNRIELGSFIKKIIVNSDFAYVISSQEFLIINIEDLSYPEIIERRNWTLTEMAVQDSIAYLSFSTQQGFNIQSELRVYNISNPGEFREVRIIESESIISKLITRDGLLLMLTLEGQLQIFDISDRSTPRLMATFNDERGFDALAINEEEVYLAGSRGIARVDLTDPRNPVELEFFELRLDISDLQILDEYLYVSTYSGMNILELDELDIIWSYRSVTNFVFSYPLNISQNLMLLNGGTTGIRFYDVSDPTTPDSVGYYLGGSCIYDIEIENDRLFVANGIYGLRVQDISDINNPHELGSWGENTFDYRDKIVSVTGSGDLAIVGRNGGSIDFLDVSNPSEIAILSSLEGYYHPYSIILQNQYLFVSAHSSGICVIDISDPENPIQIGSFGDMDFPGDYLTISGDLLFWVDNREGLWILDVSNPEEIVKVGEYLLEHGTNGMEVAIKGEYALFANQIDELIIIDISDPTNPRRVNSYNCPYLFGNGASSVAISGNYAYVSFPNYGVVTLDVSDLPNIRQVGVYKVCDIDFRLEVYQNTVIAGSYANGNYILRNDLLSVPESASNVPTRISLISNFPNPFNSTTTLSFFQKQQDDVFVSIFRLNGTFVKEVSLGNLPIGSQSISLRFDSLPTGNYLISVDQSYANISKLITVIK